ncbi:MAG: hypothetical protein AB1782_00070 [Cyanobacteriota bacterium]
MFNINTGNNIKVPKLNNISFLGSQSESQKPLAIIVDVFNEKTKENATDLVTVKDWSKTRNHGFLTTSVAHATSPDVEIMAFDYKPDCADNDTEKIQNKAKQIIKAIDQAIEIKKKYPEKPVAMNFSIIFDTASLYHASKHCQGRSIVDCKQELRELYFPGRQECHKVFDKMKEFLGYKNTRIYVAAGNDTDTLNLFLIGDSDKITGVYGTSANGAKLPFFAVNDLTIQGGQALYNVYEEKNGQRYIKVNKNRFDVFKGFGTEQERSEFIMERVKTILGPDLEGKPFSQVKHHLMPVSDLINNAGNEYHKLNDIQKEYLNSKKGLYIPIGWGIDPIEHHISSAGLFFGVNEKGMVYWSPDGSKEEKGIKCVGFVKGTSFAAPNAMMTDLAKFLSSDTISFTGKINMRRINKPISIHNIAYSKQAMA